MGKVKLKKQLDSEFRGSFVTWPELRVTREILPVMDSSNSSMCFSRGLFHKSAVARQS